MPYILSQTQDDIFPSEEKIPKKNLEFWKVVSHLSWFVLIIVKCLNPKKNKTNRQKKKITLKQTRCRRSMDIASFKEIRRIQQLENEEFNAPKSLCNNKAAVDKWNGFYVMAATVEKGGKSKQLTVIQSKERKVGSEA